MLELRLLVQIISKEYLRDRCKVGHKPIWTSNTPLSYSQRSCRLWVQIYQRRTWHKGGWIFGGKLGYVVCPGEVIIGGDCQKFKKPKSFQWLIREIDKLVF